MFQNSDDTLSFLKNISVKMNRFSNFGVVICLGRGADLHMAQLMPLPLSHDLLLQ